MNLPEGKYAIGVKWIYKTKFDADRNVVKHKARLVAKGFSQQPGIDYNQTFAPRARLDTVRTMLAIVGHYKWKFIRWMSNQLFLMGYYKKKYMCSNHEVIRYWVMNIKFID